MHTDSLDTQGFATIRGVLAQGDCERLLSMQAALDAGSAGSRCLLSHAWCRALVAQLRAHPGIAAVLPADYVAAQCIYFEKSRARNWLVPVHQDLGMPVAARVGHPELRGWSEKEGSLYVQPPAPLLERLVALRLHLDPCGDADGPLQFIAGTHVLGRLDAEQAARLRRTRALDTPLLEPGDVLLMRPLVLHASSKATGTSLRRVLHIVFGPATLPYGLRWQHAVPVAGQA